MYGTVRWHVLRNSGKHFFYSNTLRPPFVCLSLSDMHSLHVICNFVHCGHVDIGGYRLHIKLRIINFKYIFILKVYYRARLFQPFLHIHNRIFCLLMMVWLNYLDVLFLTKVMSVPYIFLSTKLLSKFINHNGSS